MAYHLAFMILNADDIQVHTHRSSQAAGLIVRVWRSGVGKSNSVIPGHY